MDISERPLQEVQFRLALLKLIVDEAKEKGDTRWEKLMPQVAELEHQIAVKRAALVKDPEPVVIKLKPAITKARAPKAGGAPNG